MKKTIIIFLGLIFGLSFGQSVVFGANLDITSIPGLSPSIQEAIDKTPVTSSGSPVSAPAPAPSSGSSSSGAGGSSSGSSTPPPCVPDCSCANTLSSAKMCSDGCGGQCIGKCELVYGTQERILNCFGNGGEECLSYQDTQIQSCSLGLECPSDPVCDPNCNCANFTCLGSTCIDPNCGKTCNGEMVDRFFTPSPSNYCLGYNFTQTGDLGCETRPAVGTKPCTQSYCNTSTSPMLYCQNNDVYGVYNFWKNGGCSVSTCLGSWLYNSCGNYKHAECGQDTCNTSGPDYEYCQDGNVWAKFDGTSQGCAGSSCYNNHRYCNHYEKETCKTGFTCKPIDSNNAECVPKSSSWTED